MSGRCRCCDAVMDDWEMTAIDPLTGTYSELCSVCISDDEDDLEDFNLDLLSEEDVL